MLSGGAPAALNMLPGLCLMTRMRCPVTNHAHDVGSFCLVIMVLWWRSSRLVIWFHRIEQDKARMIPGLRSAGCKITGCWRWPAEYKGHISLQAGSRKSESLKALLFFLLSQDTWQNLPTPPTHHSLPPQSRAPPRREEHRVWASLELLNHQPWSPAGQPQPQTQVEDFNGPCEAWKNWPPRLERADPGNVACN